MNPQAWSKSSARATKPLEEELISESKKAKKRKQKKARQKERAKEHASLESSIEPGEKTKEEDGLAMDSATAVMNELIATFTASKLATVEQKRGFADEANTSEYGSAVVTGDLYETPEVSVPEAIGQLNEVRFFEH